MACKVAVIDGGVIGLSCALALMRKGHQVALIEEGALDTVTLGAMGAM